jgi:hypothetical protein
VAATQTAQVCVFTKVAIAGDPAGNLLSKQIHLGPDKRPVADGSPCRMATGTAVNAPAPDAESLAWLIDGMLPSNALALGTIANANGVAVNLLTAAALQKLPPAQRGNSTIARTREYIAFRPQVPAWLLLDYDMKGMPAPVRGRLDTAGGPWDALLNVVPGAARAARVSRASTSAGLSHRDTGEQFPGSGGFHTYILVQDGADIDRALQALHDRCWLHGLGWYLIGAAGQLLGRSIVDATVRFPERLVFEGAPDVVPPLVQDPVTRKALATAGVAIDSQAVIPDLTGDEARQVAAAKEQARKALEPEAMLVRAAADRRLVDELVQRTGVPLAVAMRQVAARHRGALSPDIELVTDHQGAVTVRQILADPARFVGETLCDPLEGPAYGYGKAIVMRSQRNPGRLFIHSFAHGSNTYDLKHDVRSAEAVLEAAAVAHLGDVLCETVDAAELEDDEVRQLIELCVKRAPAIGWQAFNRRLKYDRARREKERRRAAAAVHNAVDRRYHRPAPPPDGELTPVILELDRALAEDDSDYPPMRRPDGTLVEMRVQAPFAMHQLAQTGANGDSDSNALPPPPEPLLMEMTPTTVELMVERYFVWERTDKGGTLGHPVALPRAFIDAFMQWADSKLPRVNAINTAPMVAENGTAIAGLGLDRDSGLLHHIEPELLDLARQNDITEQEVREAVRFLCNEWLVDVLTDNTGKLVAISRALTLIERHLLENRPAFLVSAGLRGGGKTTLIHMQSMAVYGRMAPAVSWSESQEERRKAIFALYRQGVAEAVWDNFKNGAEISCPEVEKALTSPEIRDRILGISQGAAVPTTAILTFTGNNIKFAGDMASRGPEIRLRTDDPRPEDRAVTHNDPIGWTLENRTRILRSLYTILLYGCRNRPKGQVAKTRFKRWWRLCGWPVELAASLLEEEHPVKLDFTEVFKATEEQDSQASGVAQALRLLRQEFGSVERGTTPKAENRFRARQIREILDEGEKARALLKIGQVQQAKIDKANSFLEMVAELAGKRIASPISSVIGIHLGGIVDRPVELDAATIGTLRRDTSRGERWFHVEIHGGGGGGSEPGVFENPPDDVPETGLNLHHLHPFRSRKRNEQAPSGGGGGGTGPFSECTPPDFQKPPEEDPHHAERPPLQSPVEEVHADGALILDIETFSTVALPKVGQQFYAAHPSTGVSVACYAFGPAGPVQTWRPGEPVPAEIIQHITSGGQLVAHNTAFETAILQHILGPRYCWPVPTAEQWSCTLARSAYHGFPASLEELSEAMPLANKKDKVGHAFMLRMARPRAWNKDGSPRWWHEEDPERLATLTEYCRKDVLAEQEAAQRLPELPKRERQVWQLDAAINDRGILIDVAGADALARVTEVEVARLNTVLAEITAGAVESTTKLPALKRWLGERGIDVGSLDKEHMPAVLQHSANAWIFLHNS